MWRSKIKDEVGPSWSPEGNRRPNRDQSRITSRITWAEIVHFIIHEADKMFVAADSSSLSSFSLWRLDARIFTFSPNHSAKFLDTEIFCRVNFCNKKSQLKINNWVSKDISAANSIDHFQTLIDFLIFSLKFVEKVLKNVPSLGAFGEPLFRCNLSSVYLWTHCGSQCLMLHVKHLIYCILCRKMCEKLQQNADFCLVFLWENRKKGETGFF